MRRTAPFIALLVLAAPASAQSGGSEVPPYNAPVTDGKGGGAVYVKAKRKRRPRGPVLSKFSVSSRINLRGAPARVAFRIDGGSPLRDVRIYLTPEGAKRPASTIKLGRRKRGVLHRVRITGSENGVLAEGRYTVRMGVKDSRGRRLRRAAGISSTVTLGSVADPLHRFPLGGPFSWGGPDSRFGTGRKGHTHQGQDLAAAEGTPVVAPYRGTIKTVQYQASGAGHYVVLSGAGEDRDYVFMHLKTGSIPVRRGQAVGTGQQIGQAGTTGRSSGPHLHFEIWTGGGWYSGGKPVDPLPYLKAWPR